MSTRCQIGFYKNGEKELTDWEALIYRHSDGYPEGVLPDIIPFLLWFKEDRGISDLEYCSARLLQYLCNEYDGHEKEMEKKFPSMRRRHKDENFTGTLGHGICKQFHGDIDYFYYIYPNAIKVYAVSFGMEPKGWKLLSEIQLVKGLDPEKVVTRFK